MFNMHQEPTLNKVSLSDKNSKLKTPSSQNIFYSIQLELQKLVMSYSDC